MWRLALRDDGSELGLSSPCVTLLGFAVFYRKPWKGDQQLSVLNIVVIATLVPLTVLTLDRPVSVE